MERQFHNNTVVAADLLILIQDCQSELRRSIHILNSISKMHISNILSKQTEGISGV
jgi:hypothetical protein